VSRERNTCWKLQEALDEAGEAYEIVPGPWPSRKGRPDLIEGTGQTPYPQLSSTTAGGTGRSQGNWPARSVDDGPSLAGPVA